MTATDKTTLKGYFNTGDIPTEANFADLIDSTMRSGSGVVVAAVDAPQAWIDNADYVCDGTNDEVQIQAAVDSLTASGEVVLSPGNFLCSTAGSVVGDHREKFYCVRVSQDHPAVTIRGVPGATTLKLADNQTAETYIIAIRGTLANKRTEVTNVYGLTFDANEANQPELLDGDFAPPLAGQYSGEILVENCRFYNHRYYGIQFCYIAPKNIVSNCRFEGAGGIRSESYNGIFTNNFFDLGDNLVASGISFAPDSDDLYAPGVIYQNFGMIASNNIFLRGKLQQLTVVGSQGSLVVGNVFADKVGSYCIKVAPSGFVTNINSKHNTIVGNTFYNSTGGIWLNNTHATNGAQYNIITANTFLAGHDRSPTIGIFEQPDSVVGYNYIYGNDFVDCATAITLNPGGGTKVFNNMGYVTENQGAAASVADGGTIAHGCATTPSVATVSGSVAGEIVTVTSIDATNITVAIKGNDGSAGTTQTVYWRAEV